MDFTGNQKRQDYSKEKQVVMGNCVLFPKNVIQKRGEEPPRPKTELEMAAARIQRKTIVDDKIARAFKDTQNIPILGTARQVATEAEKKESKPPLKIIFNGIKTFEEAQEGMEIETNPLDISIPITSEKPEDKTE